MTNERAIELLHRISDSQFDGIHGDERREALEMAVRALEGDGDMISRKAVMKEFSDFVRKSNNSDFAPTPTWNDAVSLVGSMPSVQPQACDDAINRDDAIMAVKTGALSAATIFGRTDEGATAYYETVKAIKALPSAQPHWIPCSERLPEEDVYVLICYKYKEGEGDSSHVYIDMTSYGQAYFGGRKCSFKEWRSPFEYFHANYEVVAWMPFPKPYGGESE